MNIRGRLPLTFSLFSLALGIVLFICLVLNLPVEHSPDSDGDGISDLFQNLEEEKELVMVEDGWKSVVVGRTSEMNAPVLLLTGALLLFVLPLLTYTYLWQRPLRRRNAKKRMEESRMLDLVRRIASFLEIDPSLQGAVRSTQSSLPHDQQGILGPLVWDPMTRGVSFEDVFEDFSQYWTGRSRLIGDALRSLGASAREKDQEKISLSVRRTMQSFDKGSRELIQEYARSLAGPSTVIFALGVLLPLMLATMIPLIGLSGSSLIMVGFLLWIVVPMGILYYGRILVERRPMRDTSFSGESEGKASFSFASLSLLISGGTVTVFTVLNHAGEIDAGVISALPLDTPSITVLGLLLSVSLIASGIMSLYTRSMVEQVKRKEVNKDLSHSLLREVGTGLEEGRSFETSVRRAVCRETNRTEGVPPPFPGDTNYVESLSHPFDHLLGTAKHFSRAGAKAGAGAVKALAGHLEEMHSMERDLASRIRSSIGQMGITASVFAPLMIGSSVGIFMLMERSSSSSQGGMIGGSMSSGMEVHHFMILSGGYLLMLGISTTLTLYRLESGRPKGGWHRVPRALVLSSLSFTFSSILSSLLIG
ncbi:MAG: hypothetical protein R6V01_11640 [Thermoplasmatota archaeon]